MMSDSQTMCMQEIRRRRQARPSMRQPRKLQAELMTASHWKKYAGAALSATRNSLEYPFTPACAALRFRPEMCTASWLSVAFLQGSLEVLQSLEGLCQTAQVLPPMAAFQPLLPRSFKIAQLKAGLCLKFDLPWICAWSEELSFLGSKSTRH